MRKILLVVVAGALGCGSSNSSGPPGPSNHPPVCLPSAASTSLVMGNSTGLDAHASDQDGDPLTYSWAQTSPASPPGSFSSATSATPTWTAPTVAQATPFILAVKVSDGKGGTASCAVTVYGKASADPSFAADVQPLVNGCFGSCHGGSDHPLAEYSTMVTYHTVRECPGTLLVSPGDPDGSALYKTMVGTCTNRMPPGGPYLDTNELSLVRTWIAQGALDN